MSSQILQGRIPAWTSQIASGFPLLAEGQIGYFYPFNFLFAHMTDPAIGYNAQILFHFVLGGLIFYCCCLHWKMSFPAAVYASILYVFGSARAGHFYNQNSQKVLVWFPLSLLLVDKLIEKVTLLKVVGLAAVFALSWVAGYQQFAAYAVGVAGIYLMVSLWQRSAAGNKDRLSLHFWLAPIAGFAAAVAGGCLLASPQLIPFAQLVSLSSRVKLASDFAYVGSVNPFGLICLFYPDWDDFFQTELYIGVLALFFVIYLLLSAKSSFHRVFIWMTCLTYLISLGGYNPLFRLFVEITDFSGRVPAKFLYFTSAFLSVCAGFGMDSYLRLIGAADLARDRTRKYFAWTIGLVLVVAVGSMIFLRYFQEPMLQLGKWFVDRWIIGNPVHPHPPDIYYAKLRDWYQALLDRFTLNHFYTRAFTILLVLILALSNRILPRLKSVKTFTLIVVLVSVWELWIYAQHGILGQVKPKAILSRESSILKILQSDSGFFRTHEVTLTGIYDAYPVYPNFNMALGLRDLGGYSPLMLKNYTDFMDGLGCINNSLQVTRSDLNHASDWTARLNAMAVKYIVSPVPLDNPALQPLVDENGLRLYLNPSARGGVYWLPAEIYRGLQGDPEKLLPLLTPDAEAPIIQKSFAESGIEVVFDGAEAGVVVVAAMNYPGWKVMKDGNEIPLADANNLFLTAEVAPGKSSLRFEYSLFKAIQLFISGRRD